MHATIRTTSDRYGHLYQEARERLRDHLDHTYADARPVARAPDTPRGTHQRAVTDRSLKQALRGGLWSRLGPERVQVLNKASVDKLLAGQARVRYHYPMDDREIPLAGGNLNPSVVRVGETVRRTAGPWTPAVHSLLRYLAGVGYPAPVPFGIDDRGREVLSFVDGVAVHPDHVELMAHLPALTRAASLIADYHDAQQHFIPPADAQWQNNGRDPSGSEEVLAHNDFARGI